MALSGVSERRDVAPASLRLRRRARFDECHRVRTFLDAGIRQRVDRSAKLTRDALLRNLGVDICERFAQSFGMTARRAPCSDDLGRKPGIAAAYDACGLALKRNAQITGVAMPPIEHAFLAVHA